MKKMMLFLTLSFIFILGGVRQVHASSKTFYEAEYIDGIYMIRDYGNITYYQEARFFRRSDGRAAYCLEPSATFNSSDNSYEESNYSPYLSEEVQKKIVQIAGFGYGYPGHTDPKWYAITQLMIWREVDPINVYYFTNGLNGPKISDYDDEMQEIYQLIDEQNKEPSFSSKTFYGVVGHEIVLTDDNQVLPYYSFEKTIDEMEVQKDDTSFRFRATQEGDYGFTLFKRYQYDQEPVLFYDNPNSQKLVTMGKVDDNVINVFFKFQTLSFDIQKVDQDAKDATSKGEGMLNDAIFTLYDKDMKEITKITLDKNATAHLTSDDIPELNYGTYYLKETVAPTGYESNDTIYSIEFTESNPNVSLTIENKIIEKELVIKKEYGDHQEMKAEANVSFEVYDDQGNLFGNITTNDEGIAKILLPYGYYTVKQITTTEGYTEAKPFSFFLDTSDKDYFYHIYDYKIERDQITVKVPNTYTSKKESSFSYFFVLFLCIGMYHVKKKLY